MRYLAVVALVVIPVFAGAVAARPNVLFIAIDDLNDWVGPLAGHPQVKTPQLDRLAARGVTFTNAHCQAPLCNPSRTSVMTGLRPSTTGVYGLDPWFRSAERWRDLVTLPQYFSARGYRTYACGKIYHDAYPPAEARKDGAEFDVWGYHGTHGPAPARKFVRTPDAIKLMDWGPFPERDEDQEDYKVTSWGVERIRTMPGDRPFFLCVGLRRPHVPCYASQRWFDLYPAEGLALPPILDSDRDDTPRFSWYLHWKLPEPRLAWMRRAGQLGPFVRAYLACVSFADSQVGRLLDALAEARLEENTVVVVWSDHGYHLGEKAITGKNSLWGRSTHVPVIFAGPGVAGGRRCGAPVELLDLYPTLIELAGLPTNAKVEGRSLAAQLKDADAPREAGAAVTTQGPGNHAVRTDRWRYIRYADGSEELYDEARDPNEWTNLAGKGRYADVKRELGLFFPKVNAAPLPGSRLRLIEVKDGVPTWEGKAIGAGDEVPE